MRLVFVLVESLVNSSLELLQNLMKLALLVLVLGLPAVDPQPGIAPFVLVPNHGAEVEESFIRRGGGALPRGRRGWRRLFGCRFSGRLLGLGQGLGRRFRRGDR